MAGELRATWTKHQVLTARYAGAVKEVGTDAWLWQCDKPDRCPNGHPSPREAIACARRQIARGIVR